MASNRGDNLNIIIKEFVDSGKVLKAKAIKE